MKQNLPKPITILCQKGDYPYDLVYDIKELGHKGLPPKDAFYSSLKQDTISDEEYKHSQKVYKQLQCKIFKN